MIPDIDDAPQPYTRLGGLLYLAIIVLGAFSEGFVTNRLIVAGDPMATSRLIMASSLLWNAGVFSDILVVLAAAPLLWIEYLLLRPVNKNLVLLAVLFNAISLAVEAMSKVYLLLVLPAASGAPHALAGGSPQLDLLALALRSHAVTFNIALIFFGITCLINGWLIYKSRYLPGTIGVLMQIAGICYLVACSSVLFAPGFSNAINPAILLPPLVGESSYCLWLLFRGVDIDIWRQRLLLR